VSDDDTQAKVYLVELGHEGSSGPRSVAAVFADREAAVDFAVHDPLHTAWRPVSMRIEVPGFLCAWHNDRNEVVVVRQLPVLVRSPVKRFTEADRDLFDEHADAFCSRCGQTLPDVDEARVTHSVATTERAVVDQLALQARQRFALVAKARLAAGLSHPRMRRVCGRDLQPGWLIHESRSTGTFGKQHQWEVVVRVKPGLIYTVRLDRDDGLCGCSTRGAGDEEYFVDDMSMDDGAGRKSI
jgi:hypothetical protein